MKKTIRALAFLIALISMTALFAGCNDTTEPGNTGSAANATPATGGNDGNSGTSFPLVDEYTEFTLWGTMNPMATPYLDSVSDASVYKYIGDLTGVHVDATNVSAMAGQDAFQILVASGDWPDVCDRVSSLYKGKLQGAYAEEFIISLNEYIPEYAPDYYALLEASESAMTFACEGGDEILTFAEIWNEFNSMSKGLVIRKDWLDDLGLDIPSTYDELDTVIRAFQSEKGADSALWLNGLGTGGGVWLTAGYDIAITIDGMAGEYPFTVIDGTVVCGLTSDNLYDYLDMVSTWYKDNLCYDDFMTQFASGMGSSVTDSEGAYAKLLDGNIGVAYLQIDSFPEVLAEGIEVVAIPDITREKGDTIGVTDLTPVVSAGWCITPDADEDLIPLICQWVNYLYTGEGSVVNSYGVQGEAWEYDENGEIAYTDLMINNQDELPWKVLLTLYSVDTGPGLFLNRRNTCTYSDTQLEAFDIWLSNQTGDKAYYTAANMTSEEEEEFSRVMSEVETYAEEMILRFITGQASLEAEWDTYVATLESLNVSRLTELKQQAYDRYVNR